MGRGVSTRGVNILIRPGVAVLSRKLWAFSVANLNAHAYLYTETAASSDASHYSAGALWDDPQFGLTHITTFSKLALVTDHDWLRHSVKLFGALMPTEIMVFSMKELDDAKAWIKV